MFDVADIQIRGLKQLERKMQALGQQLRGTETRVGNNLSYAPLVGSARFQTRQHRRTGWARDADVLREELQAITSDFQASVDAALAAPAVARNPLVPPAQRAGYRVLRRMAIYPPPPPNSTYRRTGSYGRRWTVRVREMR